MREKVVNTPPSTITALIPAAGTPIQVGGSTSSALNTLAGRPVIEWTLDNLLEIGVSRFRIGCPSEEHLLTDIVGYRFARQQIALHPLTTSSLAETLLLLTKPLDTGSALVLLGDTYVEFESQDIETLTHPTVWVSDVSDSHRWCVVELDSSGNVISIHDKVRDLPPPAKATVGVYFFPSLTRLRERLLHLVSSTEFAGMAEILESYLSSEGVSARPSPPWFDAGHPDLRITSSRKLMRSRSFNQLTFDEDYGTVTKRSDDTRKFVNEINYMRLLPPDVSVLFPRVVDFSIDAKSAFVRQEFYGYPTLAELFLYHDLDSGTWSRIARRLANLVVNDFGRYAQPVSREDLLDMYTTKLTRRLDAVPDRSPLGELLKAEAISLNGSPLRSLKALWPDLQHRVEEMVTTLRGSLIHGDLCFSNILYDPPSGVIRLIDPRGSFGAVGIGGDPRYDVAKLWHSVFGGYDFLVSGVYRLTIHGSDLELDLPARRSLESVQRAFTEHFADYFDLADVRLISGLMMCSLPPLHTESAKRQVALYARGLQILNSELEASQ